MKCIVQRERDEGELFETRSLRIFFSFVSSIVVSLMPVQESEMMIQCDEEWKTEKKIVPMSDCYGNIYSKKKIMKERRRDENNKEDTIELQCGEMCETFSQYG